VSVIKEIARLKRLPVAELRLEWRRLYGEESRSRNRDFLWKRLAWRVQELAYGGLDEATKQRLAELAPETYIRARRPNGFDPDGVVDAPPAPVTSKRDDRLPTPGTVLTRSWHGTEIRVLVHEDGYEQNGTIYGSLSALTRAVTGQRWNGRLFFGLTTRKR
jgi:hypothetical protein